MSVDRMRSNTASMKPHRNDDMMHASDARESFPVISFGAPPPSSIPR